MLVWNNQKTNEVLYLINKKQTETDEKDDICCEFPSYTSGATKMISD